MGDKLTLQEILEDIARRYQLPDAVLRALVAEIVDILAKYEASGDEQDGKE